LLVLACKKDEDGNIKNETGLPTVLIKKSSLKEYEVNDTAFVVLKVTDAKEMHGVWYWLIKQPQQETVWSLKRHAYDKEVYIKSYCIVEEMVEEQEVDFVVKAANVAGKITVADHRFEVQDH
jgi:hypothetical protein